LRRTIVVAGRLPIEAARLELARAGGAHGANVWPVEWVAARLAGGFLSVIGPDDLSHAIAEVVRDGDADLLGDLEGIRDLPGFRSSLCASLARAWKVGLDLADAPKEQLRLASMARIEEEVLARLLPGRLRPAELTAAAVARAMHAPAVLGPVEFRNLPDLDPCWRPLVGALAHSVPVTWNAGVLPVPDWVRETGATVVAANATAPERRTYSCGGPRHEVIEALRWARELLASGQARPHEVAIAAAGAVTYDDMVAALASEANLPIHFAHGRPALHTPGGQGAAALADILLRGVTQDRVRRLVGRIRAQGTPLEALPDGWWRQLRAEAALSTPERWRIALDHPDGGPVAVALLPVIDLLARGTGAAEEAGETLLRGPARALWRRALRRADAGALDRELGALRVPDEAEPAASIVWAPASVLAACPRPFVWLLGLNARAWPRPTSEDPLLPDHVLGDLLPEETPRPRADRRDFAAIEASSSVIVVRSYSRREPGGRRLGVSPLVSAKEATTLLRTRTPAHAMSTPDRLLARPAEFAATPHGQAAADCWSAWRSSDLTRHDGLVRAEHPAILRALARVQSASSLTRLLRNPIGFTWRYALGMNSPDPDGEPLALDPREVGNLVHDLLDRATRHLGADGVTGLTAGAAAAAVDAVLPEVVRAWEGGRALPPGLVWETERTTARAMAIAALSAPLPDLPGGQSYPEVPFGQEARAGRPGRLPPPGTTSSTLPWDPTAEVRLTGTDLRINGFVDRVDLSGDRSNVRVIDYKTGRRHEGVELRGGRELQRCLYAAAVEALVAEATEVGSGLLYPRERAFDVLADRAAAMAKVASAVNAAAAHLRAGCSLPGIAAGLSRENGTGDLNTGGEVDDLAFALPVVPGTTLAAKKAKVAAGAYADLVPFWGEP
jgi:hypothetical protein